MKKLCLAVMKDGHMERMLVKVDTIQKVEDIKEALGFAVDEYFEELEEDDG